MSGKCDCEKEMNLELAKHNSRLSYALTMDGGAYLMIDTEIIEKKRGAKVMLVFPSYCPFCGVKYERKATGATS